jgi:hypothetical protein
MFSGSFGILGELGLWRPLPQQREWNPVGGESKRNRHPEHERQLCCAIRR